MGLRRTSVRSVIGACAVALMASAAPVGRSTPIHAQAAPHDTAGCQRSTRRCSPGCAGARSAPLAAGGRRPSPAAAAVPSSTTSAPPAADCGRRPTGVRPGGRCRTATSRRHRSAPSPSPSRTRTSSTSAWARRSCAATSSRATASTSPPTPARRGRTSASRRRSRSPGSASTRPNPDVVYVAALGNPYGAESGARRLPIDGRRQDVGTRAVPRRQDRRGRSVDGPEEPGRALRRPVGGVPHAALAVERRARQRPVQDHRRRRALDRDHEEPRPAETDLGQGRRRRCRARIRNRVYAIIEAEDGGVFLSDDAGATWKMVNDDRRHPAARVLLHAHLRRPAGQGHGLRPQHRASIARPTPARRFDGDPRAARRQPRSLDRAERSEADDQQQRRRRERLASTPARAGPSRTFRPRSSTTSSRRRTCRITSAARSRTTARPACRAPAAATSSTTSAAARAATSRRIRGTRTSSTPAATAGCLTRINRRTGERRAINVWPDNPMGHASGDMTERFQWTYPDRHRADRTRRPVRHVAARLEVDQRRPELGAHQPGSHAPRSLDDRALRRPDHARSDRRRNLRRRSSRWRRRRSTATSSGPAPTTASCTSRVTAGKNWTNVTPPDLPDFARISLIEASPHDAGDGVPRRQPVPAVAIARPTSTGPHDYGKTWTKIVNGLRGDDFARAIREDPKRKGLLFLGTETGIYVSFDDGGAWQPLQPGPAGDAGARHRRQERRPGASATHGRVVLRRWTTSTCCGRSARETTNEPVVLFKPADATRSVSRGVAIDYYLKQPADKVTIEILDPQGKMIARSPARLLTAAARAGRRQRRRRPPSRTRRAAAVAVRRRRVAVKQGMNRFVWDMRYPDATDFQGLIMWAGSVRGPRRRRESTR